MTNIQRPKNSNTGTTQESSVENQVFSTAPVKSTPLPSSRAASAGSTLVVTNAVLPSCGSVNSPRIYSLPITTFFSLPSSTYFSNRL